MQILIIFVLFIFPCLRAQLLAPHLRGGVPCGALADGLAVRAAEVPLSPLGVWTVPTSAMVVVICFIMGGLTEVTSNVASANILLPIMAEVARATEVRSE